MKFELKRIEYSNRLSQETNAFAADFYVDGKKAGYAENAGCGGPTDVHLVNLSPERKKEVNDWVAKQPPKVYPATEHIASFSVPTSLETIADDLFAAWHEAKYGEAAQLKRWCKTKIVVRLKDDKPGVYRQFKKDGGQYTARLKLSIFKKYSGRIDSIVNETLGEKAV